MIGGAGILLAALLGLLVARTALAPIARFTRQTESIATNPERIEHERLDVMVATSSRGWPGRSTARSTRSSSSVQAQRNLVADASHELRTPIATIRANLQLMRDEELLSPEDRAALRADVIEELDELTALVGDVVELARGSKPSGEPGDVRARRGRAKPRSSGPAGGRPTLTVPSVLEPTLVQRRGRPDLAGGDEPARQRGQVEPDGRDDRGDRCATASLTVRDHGPGFKEEDLPYVFDRFHRARDARSKPGSGLGLAIVRQAAEAHDGFAEAANAPDGGAILRVGFGPTLRTRGRARRINGQRVPDPSRAAPNRAIEGGSGASRGSWPGSARVPRCGLAVRARSGWRVRARARDRSSSAARRSPCRDGSRPR